MTRLLSTPGYLVFPPSVSLASVIDAIDKRTNSRIVLFYLTYDD